MMSIFLIIWIVGFKNIGYIILEAYLLDDTIKNNIIFGSNKSIDEDYISEILKILELEGLINVGIKRDRDTCNLTMELKLSKRAVKNKVDAARKLYIKTLKF